LNICAHAWAHSAVIACRPTTIFYFCPIDCILPVVQKIRMRYEKLGRMKFSSHRDFQRALERAIRRSKIPIAYSAGFSPHPKISYANAAPTGCASLAEYIEIGLTEPVDPELVKNLINEALGDGLSIKDAVVARNKDFCPIDCILPILPKPTTI
jgi:hypothetical protein